jgi:hypothetical protein
MLVHAVKTDVGSGKTEINLQNMAVRLRQMRDSGDKRVCVVAVPTHALGDQQMRRFMAMLNAKGISAGVWRSREADADGEPMCLDRGAVKDANEALADVQTSVCQRKMPDGTVRECQHFAECRFQKQRDAKPDVMFVPHEITATSIPARPSCATTLRRPSALKSWAKRPARNPRASSACLARAAIRRHPICSASSAIYKSRLACSCTSRRNQNNQAP